MPDPEGVTLRNRGGTERRSFSFCFETDFSADAQVDGTKIVIRTEWQT